MDVKKAEKKDKSNEDIENKMQKICNKSNNYMLSQKRVKVPKKNRKNTKLYKSEIYSDMQWKRNIVNLFI